MLEINTLDGTHIEITVWPYTLAIVIIVLMIIFIPFIIMIVSMLRYRRGVYSLKMIKRFERYKRKYYKKDWESEIKVYNFFCYALSSMYISYGDERGFFNALNDIKFGHNDDKNIRFGLNYLFISYCSGTQYEKILSMFNNYRKSGCDLNTILNNCISDVEYVDFYNRAETFKASDANSIIKELFEQFIKRYEQVAMTTYPLTQSGM